MIACSSHPKALGVTVSYRLLHFEIQSLCINHLLFRRHLDCPKGDQNPDFSWENRGLPPPPPQKKKKNITSRFLIRKSDSCPYLPYGSPALNSSFYCDMYGCCCWWWLWCCCCCCCCRRFVLFLRRVGFLC